MVVAKTCIFFFFLIIGTSVLPNGGERWLVYGKPVGEANGHNAVPLAMYISNSGFKPFLKYVSPISLQPFSTKTFTGLAPSGPEPIVLGSRTYQIGKTFTDAPGSRNMYGSYTKQENKVYKNQAPNNEQGIVIGSLTYQNGNTFKGAPGSQNLYGSYTEQKNNVYDFDGAAKHVVLGSITYQNGNTFKGAPDSHNVYGAYVEQEGNVYTINGAQDIVVGSDNYQINNKYE